MTFLCRAVYGSIGGLVLVASSFAANNSNSKNTNSGVSGQISATANPQVAQYTITAPSAGIWLVSFGPTAEYGRTTSAQTIANAGKPTSIYVAGMLPETTYHMRAFVLLTDGTRVADQDRVFTTGAVPTGFPTAILTTLGAAGKPQPGIELLNTISGMPSGLMATDLQGNVIWTYASGHPHEGPDLYPGKLLPNGNFLCLLSPGSYPVDQWGSDWLREFDLAGNTIRELHLQQMNAGLSHIGFTGKLETLSHDFTVLPNGHLLLIANEVRRFTDLPGYPGTTEVVGDVVVDLDPNWKPVWFWDEFDHFDVNRHPMQFPDWTHTNSIAYSPDDGDFIVSIRHQNWIVKVDYGNGQGSGNVIWKLGEGGDFTLQGGINPTDWFYAQHDAKFVGDRSAGFFTLSIMDNGDDRIFPAGCGGGLSPPCRYSTVQLMQIDEKAMTASFLFHQILPADLFSGWGGNVEVLANGDIEYDLSGVAAGSQIFEVTNQSPSQTVWNEILPGAGVYRGFRMPSLYPDVQW